MLPSQEVYQSVKRTLEDFEKRYDLKVVIAAYGGSKSIGTDNANSDFDIYVIYDSCKDRLPVKICMADASKDLKYHLILCSASEIIDNLQNYANRDIVYPTYIYTTQSEKQVNHINNMYEREDYPRTLLYYTFLADVIWTISIPISVSYNRFKRGLCMADVCDFYFTKLHGNYDYFVFKKDRITSRKYITIVWEILYCRWIVENGTIPPMQLSDLLSYYKADIMDLEEFDYVFEKNQRVDIPKNENTVVCSDEFCKYVKQNIDKISKRICTLMDKYFEYRGKDK